MKLARLEMSQLAAFEALNQLDDGALLVDAEGGLVFANDEAERLLRAGGTLRIIGGILRAHSALETTRLHKLIAGCTRGGAEAGADGLLSLSREPDQAPLSLLVAPLRSEAAAFLTTERPVAVIFVSDPDRKTNPLSSKLRHQFGLTTAEAAFAVKILEGEGIQAAADRLAISRSTGRTHLARIFEKTGTHRQAELVRLIFRCGQGASGAGSLLGGRT